MRKSKKNRVYNIESRGNRLFLTLTFSDFEYIISLQSQRKSKTGSDEYENE